jgi:hypothetical protein
MNLVEKPLPLQSVPDHLMKIEQTIMQQLLNGIDFASFAY